MLKKLIFTLSNFIFLSVGLFAVDNQHLVYNIYLNDETPNKALVNVSTANLKKFKISPPRGFINEINDPLEISYNDKIFTLKEETDIFADNISWYINFSEKDLNNSDASIQKNLYIKEPSNWWILTEWGSLARIKNCDIEVLIHYKGNTFSQKLPDENQAPLITALGDIEKNLKIGKKIYDYLQY